MGNLFRDHGDWLRALENYRNSVAICEKLSLQDPTNPAYKADLAHSYFHVGVTLVRVTPAEKQQGQAMAEKGQNMLRELRKRNVLTAEQHKWLTEIDAELEKTRKAR